MDANNSATHAPATTTTNDNGADQPQVITVPKIEKTAGGNNAYHNFHNDFVHITDPNERRRLALAEIDKAPFGWYHIRAILVAGIGFFTDSYDVSPITRMLKSFC